MPGWQAELLSDALLGFGAQSVVVEEFRGEGQQEQERFGAEAELWDSCRLLAHFAMEVCADGCFVRCFVGRRLMFRVAC